MFAINLFLLFFVLNVLLFGLILFFVLAPGGHSKDMEKNALIPFGGIDPRTNQEPESAVPRKKQERSRLGNVIIPRPSQWGNAPS